MTTLKTKKEEIKVSDYIIKFTEDLGVKHIFLVSGGGSIHLVDSVGKSKKLIYICNHHEQASSIAAEAYSRITGNIGTCLVTTGPGSTNALTGLIGAWLVSIPVLFISGQIKRETIANYKKMRQIGDQEINIIGMVKAVTKYAVTVMKPEDIRYHLQKAVFYAKSGRPGPVWLNVPLDIQGSLIDQSNLESFDETKENLPYETDKKKLEELVSQIIKKINKSKRPVVMVGNGVRLSGSQEKLLHLIRLLRIPVLTSFSGYDLV